MMGGEVELLSCRRWSQSGGGSQGRRLFSEDGKAGNDEVVNHVEVR
jgi:hypothetical protein